MKYSIALLFAAVALFIASAYFSDEVLHRWGMVAFWLSVVGNASSFALEYDLKKKGVEK